MDELRLQSETQERVKKKFGSHKVLRSKYQPRVPDSPEREYIRLTNQYMKLFKEELEAILPTLKDEYKKDRAEAKNAGEAAFREDSVGDLMYTINRLFNEIKDRITKKTAGFGLRRKLENLATLNRKLTVKEWKKAIKATLGIDIREDYYLGNWYKQALDDWVEYNVDLIVTIPKNTLGKMEQIVYEGWTNGVTTKDITEQIQHAYGISKAHARLIARDQTAKLNGQIAQKQQTDAGIEEYEWSTSKDQRVRDGHKALEGKRFKWSDPPVVDDKTGRRCHPGEDYQCRCVALPVFNYDTLNLPITDDDDDSVTIRKGAY